MVLGLRDDERTVLLAELRAERFGDSVPWRELHVKPEPRPAARRPVVRTADDPGLCAWRQRVLLATIPDDAVGNAA